MNTNVSKVAHLINTFIQISDFETNYLTDEQLTKGAPYMTGVPAAINTPIANMLEWGCIVPTVTYLRKECGLHGKTDR